MTSLVAPQRRALWAPYVFPFACYMLFLAAGPALAPLLRDPRWLYAIQICGVMLLLAWHARSYRELIHPPGVVVPEWLLAVAVGVGVFMLWINLALPGLTLGEAKGFDPRQSNGTIIWPLVIVRVLGAAVVVPVMEELFWRSLVMRWIEQREFLAVPPGKVGLRALLLSSLVFGLEHNLWFAGLLAGLAYGWLYRRRGNLWLPIIAHAMTNLLLGIWVVATGSWQFW